MSKKGGKKFDSVNLLCYVFLIVMSFFVLAPFYWAVITSLKPEEFVLTFPPQFIPRVATLRNYYEVLFLTPAPRFFLNSFILGISTIVATIFIASHAAFSTSRYRYPGKNVFLFFILAMAFVPGITILVPLYLVSKTIRLHDTYFILILVYSAWMVPQITWLMKGFIDNLSPEVEEAALLDGCSRWSTLYRIVLPNISGGILAGAIIAFLYVWNDFLICTVLTISEDMRNIQMGLKQYQADLGVFWGRFMAYTVLAVLPVVILYVLLQRQFIKGLTMRK